MTDNTLPPAEVATHAAFVRRLAVHLLREGADADDASQETLARALEHPPRPGPGVHGWFATVLRNVVRRGRRDAIHRGRREQVVARPLAGASGDDAAGREEILRVVTDAIRALDLRSREVVLLRHYEDLPPREIAARLGVPVETVKSRLKRAHEHLRARLDEDRGGNVEGWRSALAGLVGLGDFQGPGTVGAPIAGGIAVGTATKVGIGLAAVALIGGGGWWMAVHRGDAAPAPASKPPAVVADASPDALSSPSLATRPAPATPSGAGQGAPTPEVASQSPDVPAGWIRRQVGRISLLVPESWEESPGPVPGTARWGRRDETGSGAAFGVFPKEFIAKLGARGEVVATREVNVDGHKATWDERKAPTKDGERVAVIVTITEDDASIPSVVFALVSSTVTWDAERPVLERILGTVRFLAEAPPVEVGAETDEPSLALLDSFSGPAAVSSIEGTVLLGSRPLAGAAVELTEDVHGVPKVLRRTATDARGTFRFDELPRNAYAVWIAGPGATGIWVRQPRQDRIVTVFGTGRITGRAYDRSGRPAAGLLVQAMNWSYRGEQATAYRATVAADGSYVIENVPGGSWSVEIYLPPEREFQLDVRSVPVRMTWGEAKTVDLGSPKAEARWSGVLRTKGGTTLPGPAVHLSLKSSGSRSPMMLWLDEAGRFAQRLPAGEYTVTVVGGLVDPAAKVETQLAVGDDDLVQDVTVPGAAVQGLVWDRATSRPAAHGEWSAIVRLERVGSGAPWMTAAGPDGAFAFYGVPEGEYRLWAELGPENAPRRSDAVIVVAPADRDLAGLRLELPAK
jgi:RNA polymerase sigma-70 factor (ECF subfamily)